MVAGSATAGHWEGDSTDWPVSKLALGAAVGYLSRSAGSPDERKALAGGLLAYRLVHQAGFLEINLRRTARPNMPTFPDPERLSRERRERHSAGGATILRVITNFLDDNLLTAAGFAGGFAFAAYRISRR